MVEGAVGTSGREDIHKTKTILAAVLSGTCELWTEMRVSRTRNTIPDLNPRIAPRPSQFSLSLE